MKTLKRNSSQNFPVKLNYKSNEVLFTYKGGKSTSNLKMMKLKFKYIVQIINIYKIQQQEK